VHGLGFAIPKEHVRKPPQIRQGQEDGHGEQVEGVELHGHVVGHVQQEDVGHDGGAHEGSQERGAAGDQEKAAQHFGRAGEDVVGLGGSHEPPEEPHGRGLSEGLQEIVVTGAWELRLDDLVGAIPDHGRGEREADIGAKPLMKPLVFRSFPVEERPDRRGRQREHQEAEDLDVVPGRVSAAVGLNGDLGPENVLADPGNDEIPEGIVRFG
jgi:hypothetical protein